MLNFTYEDGFKIKNKHVAGVSRTFYLSTETIRRPPQSRETIPLRQIITLSLHNTDKDADIFVKLNIQACRLLKYFQDIF
jgi:hypothetical protein